MSSVVANAPFNTNKQITRIIADLEAIMTALEGGNAKAAMARLRVPPMQDKADDKMTPVLVMCGLLIGSCIFMMLLIVVIIAYGRVTEGLYYYYYYYDKKK